MARKFDGEFRLAAIRMASEEGTTATEAGGPLGTSGGIFSCWKAQLRDRAREPPMGHVTANLSDRDEEVHHPR